MTLPGKHSGFVLKEQNPLNGGMPAHHLVEDVRTPTSHFFVRNHGPVPHADSESHRVQVTGMVQRPRTYSLDDLRRTFSTVTVQAALECAGNRRDELIALRPVPGELPWEAEAIGNAEWTGVPLAEVLNAAGVHPHAQHVSFVGVDEVVKGGWAFGFGGSIPLAKATSPEVLLAVAMNGEPLRPEHGAPLRALVPGYIGARSVKWLGTVIVQAEPSDNYFQAHAYKLFPPHVDAATADWNAGTMLGEVPVNAVIAAPANGARVRAGPLVIRGYAISGAGTIAAVEVSIDGGRTWLRASDLQQPSRWAWCLWTVRTDVPIGTSEIVARAKDMAGRAQPEDVRDVWNFKGYVNNAWHRVRVTAGG